MTHFKIVYFILYVFVYFVCILYIIGFLNCARVTTTNKRITNPYPISRTHTSSKNQRQRWMEPTMDDNKSNKDPQYDKWLQPRNSFQWINQKRENHTKIIHEQLSRTRTSLLQQMPKIFHSPTHLICMRKLRAKEKTPYD